MQSKRGYQCIKPVRRGTEFSPEGGGMKQGWRTLPRWEEPVEEAYRVMARTYQIPILLFQSCIRPCNRRASAGLMVAFVFRWWLRRVLIYVYQAPYIRGKRTSPKWGRLPLFENCFVCYRLTIADGRLDIDIDPVWQSQSAHMYILEAHLSGQPTWHFLEA